MSAVLELPNGEFVAASNISSIRKHPQNPTIIVSFGGHISIIEFASAAERDLATVELGAAWRAGLGEAAPIAFDSEWSHSMKDLASSMGFDPTHHPSNLICAAIEVIQGAKATTLEVSS